MSTTIKAGMFVEWRSEGERRPFVFFKGRVLDVPTSGKWLGKVLVDDDTGLCPRAIRVERLVVSRVQARSVNLGGGATA